MGLNKPQQAFEIFEDENYTCPNIAKVKTAISSHID
jgi:hypothetical protein